MSGEVKYPEIEVQLTGTDGNAYAVMGAVANALKSAGGSQEKVNEYYDEAMSGDYRHLLATSMAWVNVS